MWGGGAKEKTIARVACTIFFGHAPLIGVQSSYVAQLDVQLLPQLKMNSKHAQRLFLEPVQDRY
jgi:hypothetical protein